MSNGKEPAFPHSRLGSDADGMTLRDYFAAKVVGHLAASTLRREFTAEDDASYAYKVADAMLNERRQAKTKGTP